MKLNQLTFTRYIAALTVIFFHFGNEAFPANIKWLHPVITAGPVAVCYFFALSGFIMAVAYYAPNRPTKSPFNRWKYWFARVARIYPIYAIALLMIIAANLQGEGKDPVTIFLSLTMLQAWIPGYAMTLNSPGWSLSVQFFFYLLFPLLLTRVRKHKLDNLPIIGIVLWVITQIVQIWLHNLPVYDPETRLHEFIYYFPLMHVNTFILGFIVGVYFGDGKLNSLANRWNVILLLVTTILIILMLAYENTLETMLGFLIDYHNGLIAPLFLAFIVLLSFHKGWTTRLLCSPFLILLGESSYSLYILQRPIYGVYDRTIGQWLKFNPNIHFYFFVLLLTIVAIVSFKYIETPSRNFLNLLYARSGKR